MTQRRTGLLAKLRGDESGFSLAEAVIAALVLAILSVSVSVLLLTSIHQSLVDKQRVAASSLAEREMEIVRNSFGQSDTSALAVVNAGLVVNPDPVSGAGASLVDGTAYTVTRDSSWIPNGTGVSACDGGGQVTYPSVRVTVTVTWPGMGAVRPVTSDTILTPTKQLLQNQSLGFVAVKVVTFAAQASPGQTVLASLNGGSNTSQQTDSSGCAVFGLTSLGSWTFSMSQSGYVDFLGNSTPARAVSVGAGSFQQLTFTYDQAVTMNASYSTTTGFNLPSPLPSIDVANSNMPASSSFPGQHSATYTAAGAMTTLPNLGPYSGGYQVYAGGCSDANPAGPPTSGSLTPYIVTPGITVNAQALLAPVQITVTDTVGQPKANLPLKAVHQGGTCVTGQSSLILGQTDSNGKLQVSLPYGSWQITSTLKNSLTFAPASTGITSVSLVTP